MFVNKPPSKLHLRHLNYKYYEEKMCFEQIECQLGFSEQGVIFQHEIDHLQGVLMFERMTPDQRKQALAEYRRREENKIESEPTHLRLS